jgi:hypothetical protein
LIGALLSAGLQAPATTRLPFVSSTVGALQAAELEINIVVRSSWCAWLPPDD